MPWVVIEFTGKLITSPDGIAWTEQTIPAGTGALRALATDGKGTWIAGGEQNKMIRSTDTETWTSHSLGTTPERDVRAAIWSEDEQAFFVTSSATSTVEVRSRLHKSVDGITWSLIFEWKKSEGQAFSADSLTEDGFGNMLSAGTGDRADLSALNLGFAYKSSDAGVSWSGVELHDRGFIRIASDKGATTGGPINVAGGVDQVADPNDRLWSSGDGVTWIRQEANPFTSVITGLAYSDDLWLASDLSQKIAKSLDAQVWTSVTNPAGGAIRDFHKSETQSIWVMVGTNGAIATSPDGENWTQQTGPIAGANYQQVRFAGANMTLVSAGQCPARFVPAVAIIFAVEKDIGGEIELGTDLKISASRDDGVTFTEGTLEDVGIFDLSGRRILKSTVLLNSQPSGTGMRWKIENFNLKSVEIHSVEMFWSR